MDHELRDKFGVPSHVNAYVPKEWVISDKVFEMPRDEVLKITKRIREIAYYWEARDIDSLGAIPECAMKDELRVLLRRLHIEVKF
jgi:hypothetical protein